MTNSDFKPQKTQTSHFADFLKADSAPGFLIDASGEILAANEAGIQELPLSKLKDLLDKDGPLWATLSTALTHNQPRNHLVTLPRSVAGPAFSGAELHLHLSINPIQTEDHAEGPASLAILRPEQEQAPLHNDTLSQTKREVLQRALDARRRSDKRFRLFLDSAVDGIGAVMGSGRISTANTSLNAMFGETNVVGQSLFDYLKFKDFDQPANTLEDTAALLGKLCERPHEATINRDDPDQISVELTVTSIPDASLPQYVIVLRSLSQRHAFREALARSEYLEAARDIARDSERSKTNFLATVSHEMRTPIGAIATASDLLLADKDLRPDIQRLVEMIRGSADRALDQINGTLDHMRMELKPVQEQPASRFNPKSILDALCAQSQVAAQGKGVKLEVKMHPSVDLFVSGHPKLLQRVVQNLLSNAVKYTHEGLITVWATCQLHDLEDGRRKAHFELRVSDTGVGIAPENVDRMFAPFEMENTDFSHMSQSTGLGLSIVRRAVDAMGGTIRVNSTPGHGSVFTVTSTFDLAADYADYAPEAPAETTDSATQIQDIAAPDRRPQAQPLKVLVVDDNKLNRQLMKRLLESEGNVTKTAHSGEMALRLVQHEKFDAVLMDIGMPGIDGLEATRRIRRLNGCEDLPIFGLTGFSDEDVRERAMTAGMGHVYIKPLRREQVHEVRLRIIAPSQVNPSLRTQTHERAAYAMLRKDKSREIARLAGESWPNFVQQLFKECEGLLKQMGGARRNGATEDFVSLARKGGTTVASVGAQALAHSFVVLEEMAQSGKMPDAELTLSQTQTLLEETCQALAHL